MTEAAITALFRAIRRKAVEPGAVWGERAYLGMAPLDVPYPFLVYQLQAGGELNSRRARDASFLVTLKVVSDRLEQAHGGLAELSARFNDNGLYDSAAPIDGGASWYILTTTEEQTVHYTEIVDGALIHHVGAQYRIRMEET